MPGHATTDAIFILRQSQDKYLAKKNYLSFAFVELKQSYYQVPRDVV